MPSPIRQFVRERAESRCEYCRFRERHLPFWPFHLDHIVARQHLGLDDPANLAWACQRCNLRKGTNLTGVDPDSSQIVRLFDPRADPIFMRMCTHHLRTSVSFTGQITRSTLYDKSEYTIVA